MGFTKRKLVQLLCFGAIGYFAFKAILLISTSLTLKLQQVPSIRAGQSFVAGIVNGDLPPSIFLPFEPSRPRKVIILTYQRCGSTFFGQLFNKNPGVFYMYEPLDSLYSALYGTKEGWNVPSDITTYSNGTIRLIPHKEKTSVAMFLRNLLSCHVTGLPTETLIHRFWFLFKDFHESLTGYGGCLRKYGLKYTTCAAFTPKLCGKRFGEFSERRLVDCNSLLWNAECRESVKNTVIAKNISMYRQCMDKMRIRIDGECVHLFQDTCQQSSLRAVKTVRATMASMDSVLSNDPNTRVIHLVRDPRAVALSRRNFDKSARSSYAGSDVIREAEVYCRDVVRDSRYRKLLEKKFPGRIMTVVYEDMTKHPLKYAHTIYGFMNTTIHEKTLNWLIKNTQEKKNSSAIAQKWQHKLSYQTARRIMDICADFFIEVNYHFY